MKKYKTLVFYCNKVPSARGMALETFYRGILRIPESYTPSRNFDNFGRVGQRIRSSLIGNYTRLGYVNDWREAFRNHRNLDVKEINILDYIDLLNGFKKINSVDLIIILHSALGDNPGIINEFANKFNERKCPLIAFIGNEYDLLDEKKDFLRKVNVNFIASQLPFAAAKFLYEDISEAKLLSVPHACNPHVYNSSSNDVKSMDFSFVGANYPLWLGDSERNDFVRLFSQKQGQSKMLVHTGHGNLAREEWARLLVSSRGTIGAEAGTYFLDRQGKLLRLAKEKVMKNDALNGDHLDLGSFAKALNIQYVSGKAVSSRHFEALATRTVQLLVEGEYNSILEPNIHYLAVDKKFSNLHEKIEEFSDPSRRRQVAEVGYQYVMDLHTYEHRVSELLNHVGI